MVNDLLCMDELEINKLYPVPADAQQQIKDFHEQLLEEVGENGEEYPFIKHYFSDGLYAREMFMPAGTLVLGKIHLKDHLCMITSGCVDIVSRHGRGRYKAPYIFTTSKNTQRVLLSLDDSTITTIHATEITNHSDIIEAYTTEDYSKIEDLLCQQ